jgi:hypothetical protein
MKRKILITALALFIVACAAHRGHELWLNQLVNIGNPFDQPYVDGVIWIPRGDYEWRDGEFWTQRRYAKQLRPYDGYHGSTIREIYMRGWLGN